jgi:CubicO group peptidase (beta-lactamase class C family)
MHKRIFFITFVLVSYSSLCQRDFKKTFPSIDKYVDSIVKDWNMPGLALGIVYKDQLIYSKGYGYRDAEQKLPVKPTTLFPIASNTKLFTATLATMLAGEGKLSLDEPVRRYMPSLTFYNDELNSKVTLRDMLSHRTGLPRYDGIWAGSTITRKEAVMKVSYMKPELTLRQGYIYNNMMYTAAGAVLENVTGKQWEELVKEKIFTPLQMNRSVFTAADFKKEQDASLSYFEADSTGRLLPKKYEAQTDALGPAGTIKSSIEDMSHWMIAQLNGGMYKGQQLIPAKAITETLVPNIIADQEGKYPELSNALYCLGRTIQSYKGLKITSHTGSIDGFYSSLLFIPEEGIGIFMVHNSDAGGSYRSAMAFPVVDRLLGLTVTPWSQRYLADYKRSNASSRRTADSLEKSNARGTTISHPLTAYTGTYSNPIYGAITIENNGAQLTLTFRKVTLPLTHYHYDQFYTKRDQTDNPNIRLSFLTNNKGEVDRITTNLSPNHEDIFLKK